MQNKEQWVIETSNLPIGTSLSFDLTDSEGNIVHPAGLPISERLLERLARMHIHSVKMCGLDSAPVISVSSLLRGSYPSETIQAIETSISEVEDHLANSIDAINENERVAISEMENSIGCLIRQAETEVYATLAVLSERLARLVKPSVSEITKSHLIERSASLSMLSITICSILEPSQKDSLDVGIAAAFHDCSLFLHPEWFDSGGRILGSPQVLKGYRSHPLESEAFMKKAVGASERVCSLISQVHEQFDGTGFPYGLKGNDTLLSSRVLNISDAYINLIQSPFRAQPILASDAIAYLCHQSTLQRFDPHVFFCFVRGMSMYPIGSAVELDDESIAVVIRGNISNPLEPIVRILGSNATVIDLSDSPRFIMGATQKNKELFWRIEKTLMDDVLWRDDILAEAMFMQAQNKPN